MTLTKQNFNNIIDENFLFEKKPNIALALSGGPDSMGLLFLLNQWILKKKGSLIALIVDHQIRENSDIEARITKKYLLKNNIHSRIFKVNKKKIYNKSMNEARENRFEKLINFCKKKNILHLFVGHHFDDNIETFILRKIAGSNLEGLFSMQIKSIVNQVRILRPLLTFNKLDIKKFNHINNIYYFNDPSNLNIKYTRVIIRNFLINHNNDKKKIVRNFLVIQKYSPFYKKMIYQVFHCINLNIKKNLISIDCKLFFIFDREIQIKIIEIIYNFLKPKKKFLRYKKTFNSILVLSRLSSIKINLAGMIINKQDNLIDFMA